MKTNTAAKKRILIINVNWLGDVLFSTPFVKAVRKAYPDSHIACIVVPRCKDVIEDNPRINEVIIYDEKGIHKGLVGKVRLIAGLRKKRFDTVFILHRSFTRALFAYLAGIKERIGYDTKNRGFFLTKKIDPPTELMHKVEYFLNIAEAAGMEITDKSYEFFVRDVSRDFAKKLLSENGVSEKDKFIAINPGGNWDPKRWPRESFAELADRLMNKGYKVVITGADKDIILGEFIRGRTTRKPVVLCGKTNIKQLAGILEKAALVISGDSGPMHLAVSLKKPVIALFGPTSSELTGPYGEGFYKVLWKDIGCQVPCYDVSCTDNRCMKAVTVDEVFDEAEKILKTKT